MSEIDLEEIRRRHGFHALTVRDVVAETADAASFVMDIPAELADTYRYRPGQFCTFRVTVDGTQLMRCYSMSSTPDGSSSLTVTVKRVPGGAVSNHLIDTVRPGDTVETSPPTGVFCVADEETPLVAFGGGSGITPIMSILRHTLETTDRPFRLLYANRDTDSVIFGDQLDSLGSEYPDQLTIAHHHDATAGFLTAAEILEFARPALDSATFLTCGPAPFMGLVTATLHDAGVPDDRILIESFGEPPATDDDASGTVDADPADSSGDVTKTVTILLDGKSTDIEYHAGDTVLLTARRGGLKPPFSCEAGNCATCMALVKEGGATMRANTALTPDEVDEGWVLTCQAIPHGEHVIVEYDPL